MKKRYPAVTIIRKLDVGEVPRTPTKQWFNLFLTKPHKILLEVASSYGFPISFTQEQNGTLIQNVYPIKSSEKLQISSSSKTQLSLHTETAFHQYKPTVILLLCVRGDPNAVTTYADVDDITKHLSAETIHTLTQPVFTTSVDESFRTNGEQDMEIVCSILKQSPGTTGYEMCYDEALMRGMNEQATNALGELNQAIGKSIKQVVLDTGDLLVIDNTKVIHGRLPFEARYDGTDRWLLRMFVTATIPPPEHIKMYEKHAEITSIWSNGGQATPVSIAT